MHHFPPKTRPTTFAPLIVGLICKVVPFEPTRILIGPTTLVAGLLGFSLGLFFALVVQSGRAEPVLATSFCDPATNVCLGSR